MNEALVKQYFEAGDLTSLLTLFDHLHKCATRAEQLSLAYQHQMFELHKRLDQSRETQADAMNPPRRRAPAADKPDAKSVAKPRKPQGEIIDIDF